MSRTSTLENFIRERVKNFVEGENLRFEVECEGDNIKKIIITSGARTVVKGDEKEENIESEIRKILKELGVPTNLKGYRFLIDAILVCYTDGNILENKEISKKVYPSVARKNHTTPSGAERVIRYAIEKMDVNKIEKFFGKITSSKGIPTNGEFLAMISDYLYR